jgi:predicted nucleic acid-binding protein
MGLIIDTSLVIKLEREGASLEFNPTFDPDAAAISVVTVSELLVGTYRAGAAQSARRTAFVESVLERFEALPITRSVARIHAQITANLMDSGQMIGQQDRWIAATAIESGATVATLDRKDFDRIPGLQVVSPTG